MGGVYIFLYIYRGYLWDDAGPGDIYGHLIVTLHTRWKVIFQVERI